MSDPFVAEIRIFPFNFAPRSWAFCNGQLMPISQNTALFSLLGTFYGGDGKVTFSLPDMQGRAAMHPGQGPGLSQRVFAEQGGSDRVTLLQSDIPSHAHALQAAGNNATQGTLTNNAALGTTAGGALYQTQTGTNLVPMSTNALAPVGGDQSHNNMQPYLTLNFCICLQGIFPPRP
ncbi:phage tail protein [Sphingomonas kyeonggiensis]|uniref:Microcystin-dependent protein n=1 Tax=Sphingomonas kyeonggiensis TaxID=1268553 RepID=A0A7W6NW62_9SPHN|nr:tail fiber protein [Sphingomonas kyeonggiensis]MBB4098242.1 microcystin-dependent protein [Sphingomonas kyeonggiensis]